MTKLHQNYYSAGEVGMPYGVWLQPYFNGGKQSNYGNASGYRAYTYGFLFGVDKDINDKWMLGLAAGYAYTLQKSLILSETRAHINNYQLMLYGTRRYEKSVNLDWSISGGENFYRGARVAQVESDYMLASAKYIGQQYSAQAALSKRYNKCEFDLIPQVNGNLTYAKIPEYVEVGAGSYDNFITANSSTVFTAGAGIQIEWPQTHSRSNKKVSMIPELHALVYYDVNMGMFNSLSGFISGAPALSNAQSTARVTWQFGSSFDFKLINQVSIKAEYDIQLKEKYYNNIILLKFKYVF
jgi:outer membrane autotransporter protein